MTCKDGARLLELTVGGSVPPAEVGVNAAEWAAFEEHVASCSHCAAESAALRATADSLGALLRPASGEERATEEHATEEIVKAVRARLDAEATPPTSGRVLRWATLAGAAAAVLIVVLAQPWGTAPTPVKETASTYPIPIPSPADYDGPRFLDVTAESGILAEDHTGEALEKDWMVETIGHGAAVFDMDGDGDLDLFVPDGNVLDPTRRVAHAWKLFRNDGGLRFTDVSAGSGVDLDDWGCSVVAGDLNRDGNTDLFVGCYGQNRLFYGRGDGTFEDASERSGLIGRQDEWSVAAALGDIDGDGDLDLYVANYADLAQYRSSLPGRRECNWKEMPIACGPMNLQPQRDRLYLNRGDGTFDEARDALPPVRRYSFQPIITDLTGDGRADIFVAADAHPNQLLVGQADGTFIDVALASGVASDSSGHEQACMGVTAGDLDGDGRLDLLITNFSHEPNVFYAGRGQVGVAPTFADVTRPAGLHDVSFMTLGWGVSATDVDCDGDLDLLTANGHLYPDVQEHVPETSYPQHLSLMRNDGSGRLQEVSGAAGAALATPRVHRGLLVADFDNDGHPDVFATVLNGRAVILRNDGRGAGRGLHLELRRADGVTEGAGARVEFQVRRNGETLTRMRVALIGSSFASSEDPRVHLGLADGEQLTGITIRWPGGRVQEVVVPEGAVRDTSRGKGVLAPLLRVVEGRAKLEIVR